MNNKLKIDTKFYVWAELYHFEIGQYNILIHAIIIKQEY